MLHNNTCMALLIITSLLSICYGELVTLDTKLGTITGLKLSVPNSQKSIYQFRKIPFAKPPVNKLRFAKPQTYGKWNGTLNATEFGPACMQPPRKGISLHPMSEDCLYLNIYIPNEIKSTVKRSVMVWIHGGGYTFGAGSQFDGSMLANIGDVIVVTLNYRLGVFGFLSFNTTDIRGNYGLWDQIHALEWVNQNIDDFGGDPSSVTIFGVSAGGFSVSLLTLIPRNRGLFQRAIAQSGAADSPFGVVNTYALSSFMANRIGCPNNSTIPHQTLLCLQEKPREDIMKGMKAYLDFVESDVNFGVKVLPVVDGELFEIFPYELLKNSYSEAFKFFQSLDMIIGNCDTEGSLFLDMNSAVQGKYDFNISLGIPTDFLCNTMTPRLSNIYFNKNQEVAMTICKEYSVVDNLGEQSRQVINLFTDVFFLFPSVELLTNHSAYNNRTNTYQYMFTQVDARPAKSTIPSWFKGTPHGSDVRYLMPKENANKMTVEEELLAWKMKMYWSTFAKTGNPNFQNATMWPMFRNPDGRFLQLNANNLTAEVKYKDGIINFWSKLFHDFNIHNLKINDILSVLSPQLSSRNKT